MVQKINPLMEFDNYAVLLSMTRHSLGIARLSHTLVRADIESGRLVQLLQDYPCIHPHGEQPGLWILYPSRKVLHRTRLLIDHLMHYLPKVDALR